MKILVASCQFPYSEVPHAGGETVYHIIESLSKKHEIHLLSLINEGERIHLDEIKLICKKVDVVARSSAPWKKYYNALRMLVISTRFVGHSSWYEFQQQSNLILSSNHYDVVLIEFTETAMFFPSFKKYPTVIDIIDVISKSPERQQLYRKSGVFFGSNDSILQQEILLYQQADRLIVKSGSEKRFLMERSKEFHIDVIPPWVRLGRFNEIKENNNGKELLFVGALDREANSEAISFFCTEVFPNIRALIPEVNLTIVGGGASSKIERLASIPGVRITGYVPRVEPYYEKATVFVAPLKVGGGIIVKILDAMAAGKPVVTTSAGNEGIEAVPDKEILIADSAQEFAMKVTDLLLNQDVRERISREAKTFVEKHFSWDNNMSRLEDILEECVKNVRK